MFIRYTTVRNILAVLAVVAVVTVLVMWAMGAGDDEEASQKTPTSEVASTPSTPQPRPAERPTAETPPVETPAPGPANPSADIPYADVAELMLNERATEAKIKDLNRGRGAKINLYDDNGDGQWDRAKIDADRDDEDDEKWTFKDGRVERRVLADDTRYVYEPGQGWRVKD